MTIDDVKQRIEEVRDEAAKEGIEIWGWDDGSIVIARPDEAPYREALVEPTATVVYER